MLSHQVKHSLVINLAICTSNVLGMYSTSDEHGIDPCAAGTCSIRMTQTSIRHSLWQKIGSIETNLHQSVLHCVAQQST